MPYGAPWNAHEITISLSAWSDVCGPANSGPHGPGCHGGDYLGYCDPYVPECGDGLQAPTEECDDGNLDDGDGCSANCTLEECGNGIVDPGEQCDGQDHCLNDCTWDEWCGDGIVNGDEECDGEEHCLPDCTWDEWCGDGIVNGDEECEPGGDVPCTDDCRIRTLHLGLQSTCWESLTEHKMTVTNPNAFSVDYTKHQAASGSGTATPGSSTFTINGTYGDALQVQIKWFDHDGITRQKTKDVNSEFCGPICGDGLLNNDEECDFNAQPGTDGYHEHCNQECTIDPYCGDGELDPANEQCDPAAEPGDAAYAEYCRQDCTIPICGDGITDVELGETCDSEGYCRDDCTYCGDEVIQEGHGETCDGEEYCREGCTYCGDALINGAETCDPGDPDQDYCDETCEYKEFASLALDPHCAGVGTLAWSVSNPNSYSVPNVKVLVDGELRFDGTFPANSNISMGTTNDGPASHLMQVMWPDGFGSAESSQVCEAEFTPAGLPIPVTAEEPLIIPVTGLDILGMMAGKQQALMAAGSALVGISLMMGSKKKKK